MVAYYVPPPLPVVSYSVQLAIFLPSCLLAVWRGQRYERIVGAMFLVQWILDRLLQGRLSDLAASVAFDGSGTVILVWIAVHRGAPWLVIMAALQVLCLVTVVVHHYASEVAGAYAYLSLYRIWSLASWFLLLAATLMAMRRAKVGAVAQVA